MLHSRVRKTAPDETLGIVHGVGRVERGLILRRIANETLGLSECNIGRRDAVALVICDDLDATIFVDSNTRISCSQVNANDSVHLGFTLLLGGDGEQQR
mmetsp:Transcript_2242/g.3726  ORF Transcript_2242/g.3726 Transcript_2242/m.3726 type:complete len:99 (+) Transcript_2242:1875-2171(+)